MGSRVCSRDTGTSKCASGLQSVSVRSGTHQTASTSCGAGVKGGSGALADCTCRKTNARTTSFGRPVVRTAGRSGSGPSSVQASVRRSMPISSCV